MVQLLFFFLVLRRQLSRSYVVFTSLRFGKFFLYLSEHYGCANDGRKDKDTHERVAGISYDNTVNLSGGPC